MPCLHLVCSRKTNSTKNAWFCIAKNAWFCIAPFRLVSEQHKNRPCKECFVWLLGAGFWIPFWLSGPSFWIPLSGFRIPFRFRGRHFGFFACEGCFTYTFTPCLLILHPFITKNAKFLSPFSGLLLSFSFTSCQAYANRGLGQKAAQWHSQMCSQRIRTNAKTYGKVIEAYAKSGDLENALAYLARMSHFFPPDTWEHLAEFWQIYED